VIIFRAVALADSSVAPRLLVDPVFPGLGMLSIRHDKTPLIPDVADHLQRVDNGLIRQLSLERCGSQKPTGACSAARPAHLFLLRTKKHADSAPFSNAAFAST
jgi:hypothetical protein